MQAEFGVIGGTGLYDPKLLKNIQEVTIETPYGKPSDVITVGQLSGRSVAFLPRHGKKHTIRPTDINVRANIFALKKLGVKRILAPSTVGRKNIILAKLFLLINSLIEPQDANNLSIHLLKEKFAIYQ
jgi:purine nucleoside phosphorylase